MVFDTIIVAYCVNGHFIYTRNAIKTDGNGNPATVAINEEKSSLPVEQIHRLQLLVPDTSDMEGTLGYDRRAIIGRSRQFLKGNLITLMANSGGSGVATSISQVAELLVLKEGPYANSKMVLLNPDLDSFGDTDQLHKSRGKTHVPVALELKTGLLNYGI